MYNAGEASKGVMGTYVWEARWRSGLSVRELSQRSGVSRRHLTAIEKGEVEPTLPTLQRILHAVGLEARIYLAAFDSHDEVLEERYAAMSTDEKNEYDDRHSHNLKMFRSAKAVS